ncbi:Type IV pilus biogenesis protein PilE [Francisella salina]|uniref:Type IV pilus biogenesis protein PilE n=2 Tax=Francisella salina TaxID=573569 RepID=A0ABN3ZMS2_FRAST|nr:Type IV pilus biogenesis protein PilE [Francisella salina]
MRFLFICISCMNNRGFSITELMIVVAIFAIIAAAAVPLYSNYQVRAKLSGTDMTARSYIDEMTHYANVNGEFPDDDSELWGCVEVNKGSVVEVCKEKVDAQNAYIEVHVEPTLIPSVTDPYYQYDLSIVE